MRTTTLRYAAFFIALCLSIDALASHWIVLKPRGTLREYNETEIGRVAIEIKLDQEPLLIVEDQFLKIPIKSLMYTELINMESAFLARNSDNRQLHLVFDCVDGESSVFVPIIKDLESKKISLGKFSHNGCNDL